ncbi:MAG: hypothetical protein SGPRY_011648, partial [Prymnesium sp.]
VVFEEHEPAAPLLVIPNGRSMQKTIASLKKAGFTGATPLVEALGVPMSGEDGEGVVAPGGGSQAMMLQQRASIKQAFEKREQVPLLVTTEHSARGVDLKAVDVVILLGGRGSMRSPALTASSPLTPSQAYCNCEQSHYPVRCEGSVWPSFTHSKPNTHPTSYL